MTSRCASCARGWICEVHPDRAWPHEDCAGPGKPCSNPLCHYWASAPGVRPLALTPEALFEEVIARSAPDDEPRH